MYEYYDIHVFEGLLTLGRGWEGEGEGALQQCRIFHFKTKLCNLLHTFYSILPLTYGILYSKLKYHLDIVIFSSEVKYYVVNELQNFSVFWVFLICDIKCPLVELLYSQVC